MNGDNIEYRVYLVDNGQLDDFARGMVGRCQCWGICDDIGGAARRVKELAEEETMKETFSYDDVDFSEDDVRRAIDQVVCSPACSDSAIVRALESVVGQKFAGVMRDEVMRSGTPDGDDAVADLAERVTDECMAESRRLFVLEASGDAECLGFEWDGDLKWVRVAKFVDGEFVEVV